MMVGLSEEGLWQVLFVNCKVDATVSFRVSPMPWYADVAKINASKKVVH